VNLAATVSGILTCWRQVTARIIRNPRRCEAICRYGIGLDNIDVQCATEEGIIFTNVPAYCVEEVPSGWMTKLPSISFPPACRLIVLSVEARIARRGAANSAVTERLLERADSIADGRLKCGVLRVSMCTHHLCVAHS
jgi:hypothetical protein